MGILSKLKDITAKKSIDSFKELENELYKIQKKINSEIIALIGTGGRLKGLPLIYAAEDENDLKRYSARMNEVLNPLYNLSNQNLRDFIINYNDFILFFKPIMKNIGFFAIIYNKNDIRILKQLFYKNEQILKELFHEGN